MVQLDCDVSDAVQKRSLAKQLRLERQRQEQLTGTMTLAARMGRNIPKILDEAEGPSKAELGPGEHVAMHAMPHARKLEEHEDVWC